MHEKLVALLPERPPINGSYSTYCRDMRHWWLQVERLAASIGLRPYDWERMGF